jgi:hypothetical protein
MLRDNVTPTGASAGVDVGKANGNGGIDRHSPRQWNKSVMKGRRRCRANGGGAVASRCRMIVWRRAFSARRGCRGAGLTVSEGRRKEEEDRQVVGRRFGPGKVEVEEGASGGSEGRGRG